jgi:hypothetical protein
MTLEKHTDRFSCEISTTVCLGYNYVNALPDYNWGMYLGTTPTIVEEVSSINNIGKMISQQPGDIIIYRGCEVEHWRDPFVAGTGSWQVQAFLHYINKDGPYYPEYAYDKRPGLGFKVK